MANKKRLDITMESDFLQSFVRGNLSAAEAETKDEKSSKQSGQPTVQNSVDVGGKDELLGDKVEGKGSKAVKIVDPKSALCPKFLAQNSKDKEKQNAKHAKRKVKRRMVRSEELYTDKDRAAAVNLGTRDIKHSLKLKRAQDRSRCLHIPEEADPAQFLALGYYELKKRETQIALNFINKALELNPNEKNALVARSKCYILLGQPESGLKDAEAALGIDKKFLKAIYQKAESLYYLGDFEHSLMYFHRGLHIRPDHEDFKLGVEKAQKAIETALGVCAPLPKQKTRSKSATPTLPKINDDNNNLSIDKDKTNGNNNATKSAKGPRTRSKSRPPNCKLLKELAVDKEYLESLLKNPNLRFAKTKETDKVLEYVQETVDYLNKRQEFWRQQVPVKHK